jgi:hypothetical protein
MKKYKLLKINLQNNRQQERLINKGENADMKISKAINFPHLLHFHIYLKNSSTWNYKRDYSAAKSQTNLIDGVCDLQKSKTL